MKVLAWLLAIFAIISCVAAYKHEVCGLPHSQDGEPGKLSCHAFFELWTYDQEAKECIKFIYGGCNGNDNSFESKEACEEKCKE